MDSENNKNVAFIGDKHINYEDIKLGFIGAGNMAYALSSAIISSGTLKAENVWASAPSMNNLPRFKDLGCNITHDNKEVVTAADIIVLGVKPNKILFVIDDIRETLKMNYKKILVSVMGGVKIRTLEEHIVCPMSIIRTMPNIPVQAHAGVIGYAMSIRTKEEHEPVFNNIFGKIAMCRKVLEEQLDAVCGLSGSGPAFVFTIIQALADGGVKMGLSRDLATDLAAQTVMGAGKLVLHTGMHPAVLRDSICSPAGTTIQGIHALEKTTVSAAFIDAVEAATKKSIEFGQIGATRFSR